MLPIAAQQLGALEGHKCWGVIGRRKSSSGSRSGCCLLLGLENGRGNLCIKFLLVRLVFAFLGLSTTVSWVCFLRGLEFCGSNYTRGDSLWVIFQRAVFTVHPMALSIRVVAT